MKRMIAAAALLIAGLASAQMTPVGLWKTIDDDGKTEKSYVRISDASGVVGGKIEKVLDPKAKPDDVCDKCSDERKDKPIVGLAIIRNAKKSGDDTWEGGDITDPNNGKVYKLRLKPLDGGKKLEVRGYIGPFFRNQQWVRAE